MSDTNATPSEQPNKAQEVQNSKKWFMSHKITTVLIILSLLLCGQGCEDVMRSTLPKPPIEFGFQRSFLGAAFVGTGYNLWIKNTGTRIETFEVTVTNPTLKQEKVFAVVLEPGQTKHYGLLEINWIFIPGEEIVLRSVDYQSTDLRWPTTDGK